MKCARPARSNAPQRTCLGQALISGVLAGGMYGLLALGLSLSWGLLRRWSISATSRSPSSPAYLTYELGTTYHVAPWWAATMVVPVMFVIGLAQHWLFDRFKVNELASLLITFSFAVILEVAIQLYWTADYRRFETHYSTMSIKVGAFLHPRARAGALHGGGRAGLGHLAVAAQDLCRQGPARLPPRMPTSPRPTASTTRSSPTCCRAWAPPTPASPAPSSR